VDYAEFLDSKRITVAASGFEPGELNPMLFGFQADIDRWALRRGRAAIFSGCGTGKTFMEAVYAEEVVRHTNGPVLIVAPLAVSYQTIREAQKFDIQITLATSDSDIKGRGVYVTNYEKLAAFPNSILAGVILDESSRLKDHSSATRNQVIQRFQNTPFRLAGTATPAPNDYMELANHSEFLGALTRSEMLATWYVHDGGDTSKWRLKKHAEEEYWKWVCSWAVMLQMPSDLGYSDDGFVLPPLHLHHHVVKSERPLDGYLFQQEAQTLNERRQARRASLDARARLCADLVAAKPDEPWMIWVDLNDEGDLAERLIPDAVQIAGRHSDDEKESRMLGFTDGSITKLVSKPSICGHGMNFQHCANIAFLGLSDSWERFYQAVRRFWRFGQSREVNCHIITSELEGAVVRNIERKEADAATMAQEMIKHMSVYNKAALRQKDETGNGYHPASALRLPSWIQSR
jgi:hypothetical protein